MKRKFRRNKKAISTIIATIIIVSVSIVMAISVAFWAMGIGNSFTKFEKVEFTSIYSDPASPVTSWQLVQSDGSYFNGSAFAIYVTLKNTGTAAATITNIFLNSRPYDSAYTGVTQTNIINQTLAVGQGLPFSGQLLGSQTLGSRGMITMPANTLGNVWSSGSSVEVDIITAAGRSYSNTVTLP